MTKKLLNYKLYLKEFTEYIDELIFESHALNDGIDTKESREEINTLRKLKLRTMYLKKRLEYLEKQSDFTNRTIIKTMMKCYSTGELFILNESRVFPQALLTKLHELFNEQIDKTLKTSTTVIEETVSSPITAVKETLKQKAALIYKQLSLF